MKRRNYIIIILLLFLMGIGLGGLVHRNPEETTTDASASEGAREDPLVLTLNDFPEEMPPFEPEEIPVENLQETLAGLQNIRVLLLTDGFEKSIHEKVAFRSAAEITVEIENCNGESRRENYPAGQTCTIEKQSLENADRKWTVLASEDAGIELLSLNRNQGHPVYEGKLEIYREETGFSIINELSVEQYLYGVVPSEMPASYPMEALKAQAICARTYAYSQMLYGEKLQHGADVNDSTSYQVYQNISQQDAASRAVDATQGMILLKEGGKELLTAYYYSTSCGVGTDERIWSAQTDREAAFTGRNIDHVSMETVLRGTIEEEDIIQTGSAIWGNQLMIRLSSPDTDDFEKEEPWYRWEYENRKVDADAFCKRLFKLQEQKDQLVLMQQKDGSFQPAPVQTFQKITGLSITKRGSGGVAHELLVETENGTYKVITENMIRKVLCDGKTKVGRGDGASVNCKNLLPSGFFLMEFYEDRNDVGFKLIGGGLGHGVGMSQNGAKVMAMEGYTMPEILQFFYGGCLVESIGP